MAYSKQLADDFVNAVLMLLESGADRRDLNSLIEDAVREYERAIVEDSHASRS